ncbi:MAG: O-antigen ligase family protein [Candidatus Magasanikbacteria bacterium]|nr:O-antigen ligase family protein [Candidatus Magasanikbacteria bacterium]
MLKFLANPKKIFNENVLLMVSIFIGVRILSFFLAPHLFIQAIISLSFVFLFGILYFYKPEWAWIILIGELFLGGAGHFFEFAGLSIRTMLVLTFIALWFITPLLSKKYKHNASLPVVPSFLILLLLIYLGLTSVMALVNGHGFRAVVQDFLPFSILLLTPASYYFLKERETQIKFLQFAVAFITGSFIFSLFNFIVFSAGFTKIHGIYYKWFRDVAMGKITEMGDGFFRIVTPEHLLLVVLSLVLVGLLIKKQKDYKKFLVALLLFSFFVLILNFSRAYFLGFGVGLLTLKYKHSWTKWTQICAFSIASVFLIFFGTSLLASGGSSLGLPLLGVRTASFVQPQIETSTATRMTLITPIFDKIKASPIVGSGLGATITYTSLISYDKITTRQFDWGYFEMLAELGIIGLAIFLALILYIKRTLITKINIVQSDYKNLYIGLFAGLIALLIINITTPALFHTLGLFFIVIVISISSNSVTIWEKITDFFTRFVHK